VIVITTGIVGLRGASRSMKIASAHKSLISLVQTRHFHGSSCSFFWPKLVVNREH
jgi:hypothetical protein